MTSGLLSIGDDITLSELEAALGARGLVLRLGGGFSCFEASVWRLGSQDAGDGRGNTMTEAINMALRICCERSEGATR